MPRASLSGALGAGIFPHQLAWLIDNPLRGVLLPPAMLLGRLPLAADSRVLPFRDASFDLVLLVAVLGEVPDQGRCLAESARLLRRGGTLAVHEHIPDPDRIRFADLAPRVAAHGFRLQHRYGADWNYTALFTREA